jgi:hypothetical protein
VVFDWSPVAYPLYIHYPYHFETLGIPIITRFDSDLVARFDSATGKDATGKNQLLAFNNMQNALRLGPELALTILPDPGYVSGNFGIKGTYNTGQNVNTGKATNIYTIGLSAKI